MYGVHGGGGRRWWYVVVVCTWYSGCMAWWRAHVVAVAMAAYTYIYPDKIATNRVSVGLAQAHHNYVIGMLI